MKTKQTSIAIINDVSGYGRCSITVALPILSAMKVSCGIVPTAILSNQTEYDRYTMLDFTPHMNEYIAAWQQLHFSFDGLYTGFLGSSEQITIIKQMIHDFSFEQIIFYFVYSTISPILNLYPFKKSLISMGFLPSF